MGQEPKRPRPLIRILGAPFRRRRWIGLLLALRVLPWGWIRLFTPAPGPVSLPDLPPGRTWPVWVVVRSHHSSLIVEQPRGWKLGQTEAPDAPYVEYAWGDRRFYKDSNFWPHALFAAVFLPTESVTYVRSHARPPEDSFRNVGIHRRDVDPGTLRRLIISLEESMVRTTGGHRAPAYPVAEGYSGRFHPGRESYIFWSSCNTWTLRRLQDAGIDVSPTAVIFAAQVPGRLEGFDRLR